MKRILVFITVNLSYFIAKRLATSKKYKNSVSAPIIKIAVAAVAISVVMMLVSVATGLGLQQKIRDKITSFNGHVVISNFDNNQSNITLEPISTDQSFYPKFTEVPEVKSIHAFSTKAGVVRTEKSLEGMVFKGVDANYQWEYLQEYLVDGKLPQFETDGMTNDVIISSFLADRLELKTGDKIQTYFLKNEAEGMPSVRTFTVSGIYSSGFPQFDELFIIGDLKHVQRLNKWKADEVGGFEVFVNDFSKIDVIADEIYAHIPSTLNSEAITTKFYNIFEWLKLFDFNIYIILGLMVLVASINMIVALLVLILERTQMIGILKAIGANNWQIRKIFMHNATYIIFIGLLIGNAIGLGLLFIQKQFGIVKLDPTQYYVTEAPVYLPVFTILLINAALVILCYLILLLPSYIVTKISPIKSIKFQ
ncbi:MAG TPA: FtsX-like permease family protein [Flavobacterium sp.]|nr:FtsX-like permease family protein [Flavobacterium sp.]